MLNFKECTVYGLTGGVYCMGAKEVKSHAHTKVFRIYYKWPCDNPKIYRDTLCPGCSEYTFDGGYCTNCGRNTQNIEG